MASRFAADVGKAARGVPRAALAVPRAVISLPGAVLRAPSKRTRIRLLVGIVLLAVLAAAYMLWFRNSSLVAVEKVEVSGISFAEEEITAALTDAGETMTTLNADVAVIERSVEGFPTVAAVSIEPDFPHRLAITVDERGPVATVGAGGGLSIAGDGTILNGVSSEGLNLPQIELDAPPSSGRLGGVARAQAEVLGAAPAPLRPAIEGAEVSKQVGVVVNLVEGIELRFGDSSNAPAKWAAATTILADPNISTLAYIDLRLPGRPAVGGTPLPESAADEAAEAAPDVPAVDPAATAVPVEPVPAAPIADPAASTPVTPSATPAPAPATDVAGGAPAP
ncbi:MAG: cell division protein FtsQ/DivIB [Solirubrobacterales bacterium]